MNLRRNYVVLCLCISFLLVRCGAQTEGVKNTCIDCHSLLEGRLQINTEQYSQDVHAQKGLTCADCHGGDPAREDVAMEKSSGFRGHVARSAVPNLCGTCHSDGVYMRQYNPSLRTDQLVQYRTSVHGKKVSTGDQKAAVCTDCHGVHGIRSIADRNSPVHPLNVAKTCSRCHSDHDYMKGYNIPTDQYAAYSASVHQEALAIRGDLSAPTCTTCHGNHGASPPGVSAVENVCSTCHAFQAQLFDSSPHKTAFFATGQAGCVTCHSNHRIVRPTDAMVGTSSAAICTDCHAEGDAGWKTAGALSTGLKDLQQDIKISEGILTRAARSGMEVSEPQLQQREANDWLMKARVSVHSFNLERVQQDLKAGESIARKTYRAGEELMHERNRRRMGLGISVLAIFVTLVGLKLWIVEIERK